MSYSICLKCQQMVGYYDKYCKKCQDKFGLPDLPDFQKEHARQSNMTWEEYCDQEVKNDLSKEGIE